MRRPFFYVLENIDLESFKFHKQKEVVNTYFSTWINLTLSSSSPPQSPSPRGEGEVFTVLDLKRIRLRG